MDTTPNEGSPTRRQLLTLAGAAAGAAALGGIGFSGAPAFAAVAWRYPFRERHVVSSGFGPRVSPGGVGSTNHQGIDFAAGTGTQIYAIAAGTVIDQSTTTGYGWLTKIQHGDGYVSWYGHQSAFQVSKGAKVSSGQKIGRVGSTGNSTGAHLHLGITLNGTFIDPAPLIVNAPLPGDSAPPQQLDDDFTIIRSPDAAQPSSARGTSAACRRPSSSSARSLCSATRSTGTTGSSTSGRPPPSVAPRPDRPFLAPCTQTRPDEGTTP